MTPLLIVAEFASSSLAGTVTAVAICIAAVGMVVGGLILSVVVLRPTLRTVRGVETQVGAVHTIVNQQRTDALNFQRALIRALTDAGIPVPIDQSLPEEPAV